MKGVATSTIVSWAPCRHCRQLSCSSLSWSELQAADDATPWTSSRSWSGSSHWWQSGNRSQSFQSTVPTLWLSPPHPEISEMSICTDHFMLYNIRYTYILQNRLTPADALIIIKIKQYNILINLNWKIKFPLRFYSSNYFLCIIKYYIGGVEMVRMWMANIAL